MNNKLNIWQIVIFSLCAVIIYFIIHDFNLLLGCIFLLAFIMSFYYINIVNELVAKNKFFIISFLFIIIITLGYLSSKNTLNSDNVTIGKHESAGHVNNKKIIGKWNSVKYNDKISLNINDKNIAINTEDDLREANYFYSINNNKIYLVGVENKSSMEWEIVNISRNKFVISINNDQIIFERAD